MHVYVVCQCVYLYVCGGRCMSTCMYMEARCWCQVFSPIVPQLIFLRQGLPLNQMLSGWIDCQTSELRGSACLCLPHVKVIVSHDNNWYFVVLINRHGDRSSGPHACMTEILLTELISMTQLLLTSHLHFLPFTPSLCFLQPKHPALSGLLCAWFCNQNTPPSQLSCNVLR